MLGSIKDGPPLLISWLRAGVYIRRRSLLSDRRLWLERVWQIWNTRWPYSWTTLLGAKQYIVVGRLLKFLPTESWATRLGRSYRPSPPYTLRYSS